MSDAVISRIMPVRSFVGQSANFMIHHVLHSSGIQRRPLRDGERKLGAYIVPDFQRPAVWREDQRIKLIESIYMGLPIGSLVFNSTTTNEECDGWLLDGQQRLSAMVDYVAGEIEVCGWKYANLPEIEQRHFQRITVPVIETAIEDRATCLYVYERLAFGGTAHTEEDYASLRKATLRALDH